MMDYKKKQLQKVGFERRPKRNWNKEQVWRASAFLGVQTGSHCFFHDIVTSSNPKGLVVNGALDLESQWKWLKMTSKVRG